MAEVGRLFTRIFEKKDGPAPEALTAYLAELFLDAPDRDAEITSKVHVRGDGTVNGFIGVLPLPLNFEGRPLRGAVCGSLMVDERDGDPFAGARLMRSFLSGPQDISLSETANPVSEGMWRKLRGMVLPSYSLEWVRVLRPAGFALDVAARSIPLAALMRSVTLPVDALARRVAPGVLRAQENPGAQDREIGIKELAELLPRFVSKSPMHPVWSAAALKRMLQNASRKSRYGTFIARAVTVRGGAPIGAFLYYVQPGRIAHVLQVVALPGQAGTVLDRLFLHAEAMGAVAVRGRSQPFLLDALLTRNCFHVHRASSLVHARDESLIEPFLSGRAFFNGLAGDSWTRLVGDEFANDAQGA
ncbi:MAG: hypothetical protein JNJ53_13245 [Rhizobiales bacterium]|nr:hypothetical protein [Hyphomicrobiales bacterium]